ncbi:autoinducer binding domain-containing protein [Phyllobacterium sp. YR531]|uniref:autoinducer binding domain-containing protein n=1 Tax=Phyllobacterium sp. YR531 TaxID=1144343 RepID=UPI00026FA0FF|nr:autoinducer binding domain-containing protein [Phyllobacterium sp. YR531]EJN05954.1 DNA-binding protein with HTH domain containing protein [Phyllobacterium sp. YR531]
MDGQFQSLIDALDVTNDERTVRSALKSFTIGCGFERFAYLQTAGGEIKTFNSYLPEWQDIYFANRYSRVDPVVTTAKRRKTLFVWSADQWLARNQAKEQKLFQSQAIDFGVRSGITVPVEGSFGSILMLTVASSRSQVDAFALGDHAVAARAVLYVHHRLRMLAARSFSTPKILLSPRELVCLKWSAKGKYMPEIAELTNTRHRTVQYYLDNARAKLEATNLTHAVAIMKDRGLLEPD